MYVEGIDPATAATLGTVVSDPAEAGLAVVRLQPPYEPRDDLFLETYFRQGSLDFRPGLVSRLARIAARTPLDVDVNLDRPAILTPLAPHCTALTVSFGTSAAAWIDAITGTIPPRGRLPFEIPRSMDAVRASRPDVPRDTKDPIYPAGTGLGMSSSLEGS